MPSGSSCCLKSQPLGAVSLGSNLSRKLLWYWVCGPCRSGTVLIHSQLAILLPNTRQPLSFSGSQGAWVLRNSSTFFIGSMRFSTKQSIIWKTIWIHPFQSCLFFLFSCFIALSGTSGIVWNKSDEYGCPCLFPDLRRKSVSFLSLRMKLAVRIFTEALFQIENFSFYFLFDVNFY